MKDFNLLAVLVLLIVLAIPALAHPGSGIVVDNQGRVFFAEAGDIDARLPGAIWQIYPLGKLTRLHVGGAHYLTLDPTRGFAQTNLDRWFGRRITPWLQRVDTSDAALIQADGQPIVIRSDGTLYYAKRNVELIRLTTDGRMSQVAPTLEAEKLGGIRGLAFGPADTLYVAFPAAILKAASDGRLSTLIESIVIPDCDKELPPNTPENQASYLRGLAVDERTHSSRRLPESSSIPNRHELHRRRYSPKQRELRKNSRLTTKDSSKQISSRDGM